MTRTQTFDVGDLAAAGLRVVESAGWTAISVRSVAERLGVSPMALYRVAPDAQQLRRVIADAAAAPITAGSAGRRPARRAARVGGPGVSPSRAVRRVVGLRDLRMDGASELARHRRGVPRTRRGRRRGRRAGRRDRERRLRVRAPPRPSSQTPRRLLPAADSRRSSPGAAVTPRSRGTSQSSQLPKPPSTSRSVSTRSSTGSATTPRLEWG